MFDYQMVLGWFFWGVSSKLCFCSVNSLTLVDSPGADTKPMMWEKCKPAAITFLNWGCEILVSRVYFSNGIMQSDPRIVHFGMFYGF